MIPLYPSPCTRIHHNHTTHHNQLFSISEEEEEEPEPPRNFTLEQLREFDGEGDKPIYVAVKGDVFDVTRGRTFYGKGGWYGVLAGRDASRALALMSTVSAWSGLVWFCVALLFHLVVHDP